MSKILVVDDSMVIRKMIKKTLEESNHEVIQAENGQEGFSLFQENDIDLLITDINMPIMNGFELIEKVKEIVTDAKKIPIIVVSTEFSDEVKARGKKLGVSAWMVKPTQDDVLNEAVTTLIERAK